jgi:hypothetical protein
MDIKFKRFEPITPDAKIKIKELLERGGAIVVEKREFVDIERYQSVARIDQKGRVEWRQK